VAPDAVPGRLAMRGVDDPERAAPSRPGAFV